MLSILSDLNVFFSLHLTNGNYIVVVFTKRCACVFVCVCVFELMRVLKTIKAYFMGTHTLTICI